MQLYLLSAISGVDEKIRLHEKYESERIDYVQNLNETSLKGMRIGIVGNPFTERLSKHKLALLEACESST